MRRLKLLADWTEKAEVFFKDAERHLLETHYWLTCFEAHQAAEPYLKSLIVSLTGFHPYTHDLFELADALRGLGIEVYEEVYNACEALTPHYALSRYLGRRASPTPRRELRGACFIQRRSSRG